MNYLKATKGSPTVTRSPPGRIKTHQDEAVCAQATPCYRLRHSLMNSNHRPARAVWASDLVCTQPQVEREDRLSLRIHHTAVSARCCP